MSIIVPGELAIFNDKFLVPLPIPSIYALSCTSKGWHKLITDCATCPQPDITLEGTSFTIILEPANQTVKGILRQKLKVEALTIKPELLLGFNKDKAMVLFDKENKHPATGDNGLQEILMQSKQRDYPNQFVLFVLTHPNAPQIPTENKDSLGWTLQCVTNPRLVRILVSLPQAKDIPAEQLNCCMIHIRDEKSLKLIFSLPNSKDIQASGFNCLCGALAHYVSLGNEPCAKRILRHPNIFKSSSLDHANLEQALKTAKKCKRTNLEEEIQIVINDTKVLRELKTMLEAPNSKKNLQKIGSTFVLLSARVQHLLYKVLCQVHGRRSDDVDHDGMFHLVKNSSSLLPIIKKLTEKN